MLTFDEYLEMALTMHRGCLCPGQVLGTRMALLGCCYPDGCIEFPLGG